MEVNFDEILKDDAFKNVDENKVAIFKEIADKLEGKNASESMRILLEYQYSMPQGKSVSAEEKTLMLNAIMKRLPETERIRFSAILKMAGVIS